MTAADHPGRVADHPIESLFVERWSPRAMSGAGISAADLARLFEAARWAPSTNNEQEWRYLYAHRDTPAWERFFGLLAEGNKVWCKNAGVLICIVARKTFSRNNAPNPVYAFDAGASFENVALQGTRMGLIVHGMAGFDFDKARRDLKVPEDFAVMAMCAVGHPGDPRQLPDELRQRERPSGRKKVSDFAFEGGFPT